MNTVLRRRVASSSISISSGVVGSLVYIVALGTRENVRRDASACACVRVYISNGLWATQLTRDDDGAPAFPRSGVVGWFGDDRCEGDVVVVL